MKSTATATAAGSRWGHTGGMPGTSSWMFHGPNGISVAIAANHLPEDEVLEAFFGELDAALTTAGAGVRTWPGGNSFPAYLPGTAPRIAEGAVVNAATLRQGPVAAGSIVRIFGTNLERGVVRVNGAVDDTLWTDASDLQVRVPLSARGRTQFQVTRDGQPSNMVTVEVAPASPGIFTLSRNGYGQVAALNQNLTLNSISTQPTSGHHPDEPAVSHEATVR